jgi:hypothetical protein
MLEFLIDIISVMFGGHVFKQPVHIPMDTNCDPFHADLFIYSYETGFMQVLASQEKRKGARQIFSAI